MLSLSYILKTISVNRRGCATSINHAGLQAPSKSCLQPVYDPRRAYGDENPPFRSSLAPDGTEGTIASFANDRIATSGGFRRVLVRNQEPS